MVSPSPDPGHGQHPVPADDQVHERSRVHATRRALPHAILWDMDGTLVDTEPHWFHAEAQLMADHDLAWSTEDSMAMLGFSLADAASYMCAKGLRLSTAQIGEALDAMVLEGIRQDLRLRPGALELLTTARATGVPCALVTNSGSVLAQAVITELTDLARGMGLVGTDLFDVVVTSDLALPAKPDPAPYTFAARRLSALAEEKTTASTTEHDPAALQISRMIAIEDSQTGIRSAVTAGAVVVGVPNLVSLEGSGAHVTPGTLTGVTLEDLGHWASGARTAPTPHSTGPVQREDPTR